MQRLLYFVVCLLLCGEMIRSLKVYRGLSRTCFSARIPCRVGRSFSSLSFVPPHDGKGPSNQHNEIRKHCEELELEVRKSIESCKLQDANFLLCVSGGSDSMAMMHIIGALRKGGKLSGEVAVVNFNHKMRKESDEEAVFVEDCAKLYQMPFYCRTLPEHLRLKTGFQASSRSWRYQESAQIAQDLQSLKARDGTTGSSKYIVCTAHTRDDQLETIMMKFIRGVHISNLQGMSTLEGSIFRPLLSISKADLVTYLNSIGAAWREDASNQDRTYKRNHVRLDLFPLLEQLTGSPKALAYRLENLARQSASLQQWIADELPKYDALVRYVNNNSSNSDSKAPAHVLRLNVTTAKKIPALVLSEMLFRWITAYTDFKPSSERLELLQSWVTHRPPGIGPRVMDLGASWLVKSVKGELQLYRKVPTAHGTGQRERAGITTDGNRSSMNDVSETG